MAELLEQKIETSFRNPKTNFLKTFDLLIMDLKKIVAANGISFILVDNECNVVFESSRYARNFQLNICKQLPVDSLSLKGMSGFLSQPFVIESTNYYYFKKVTNHSLTLFTGFNKNLLERELHHYVFPKLYELIFMGFFCIVILYFFRKIIITPLSILSDCAMNISKGNTHIKIPSQNSIEMFNLAKALIMVKHYIKRNEIYRHKLEHANEIINASSQAREDFVKSIDQELTYPLKEILIYTEILLNSVLEYELPSKNQEKAMKCIEKIREAAINIKAKTSNSLNLTYFDFNHIIEQAVQINLKNSFVKKIEVKTYLSENMPSMYGDELKLKKILVGLVSQAIGNSPENQEVKVSSSTFLNDNLAFIKIMIQDNGFGLSEEELQRIQYNVGWQDENNLFENMEYRFIEKFIKMHQGEFDIVNKLHKGRTVTLILPLLKENEVRPKARSNIYYLPEKV